MLISHLVVKKNKCLNKNQVLNYLNKLDIIIPPHNGIGDE